MKNAIIALLLLASPAAAQQTTGIYVDSGHNATPQTLCAVAQDGTCALVGVTSNLPITSRGGSSIATAQISVGTNATLVAATRNGRQKITLGVTSATTCAFGPSGVTSSTGFALQPVAGATLTIDTQAAVYAVCSAATTINVLEQF